MKRKTGKGVEGAPRFLELSSDQIGGAISRLLQNLDVMDAYWGSEGVSEEVIGESQVAVLAPFALTVLDDVPIGIGGYGAIRVPIPRQEGDDQVCHSYFRFAWAFIHAQTGPLLVIALSTPFAYPDDIIDDLPVSKWDSACWFSIPVVDLAGLLVLGMVHRADREDDGEETQLRLRKILGVAGDE